ncbi:transposase [Clostridioides difficile]|nr:transposase [Clostridioides difficile]MCB4251421.1 transposase [Clostridioides difficile]MCB4254785.1 transposase [Clostridioides difficile]MCC8859934.1 transposase [Clostridioides difficile]MCC8883063.1 transposase [Clostridioides difficile]MCD8620081.1 transposase [Clostridioides difficile]
MKSDFGEITLNISRKRNEDFELKVIRNYENDILGIKNQVIGIYSKDMSTQNILSHLKSIYGIDIISFNNN